ncbi:MAG: 50S ribosomal protein L17 [Deltaproteobacteria bacterium]|nr:MAG: 50S ribosomal protein L17 [Deltaproteobacteria bacterium]
MRHRKAHRKLNRTSSHRAMMLRNMVTEFFRHERIETTLAKAKELRPFAERLITLGKRGDLAARREALKYINDKAIVRKLFDEIAPRFRDREGGYTHLFRTGFRKGDGAPMSVIELVPTEKEASKGS